MQSFCDIVTKKKDQIGELEFEKDDLLIMKFVAAATNLKVYNFIEDVPVYKKLSYQTYRKVKEDAGNIIYAIASTNAIAAGTQVSESIKILSGNVAQL